MEVGVKIRKNGIRNRKLEKVEIGVEIKNSGSKNGNWKKRNWK